MEKYTVWFLCVCFSPFVAKEFVLQCAFELSFKSDIELILPPSRLKKHMENAHRKRIQDASQMGLCFSRHLFEFFCCAPIINQPNFDDSFPAKSPKITIIAAFLACRPDGIVIARSLTTLKLPLTQQYMVLLRLPASSSSFPLPPRLASATDAAPWEAAQKSSSLEEETQKVIWTSWRSSTCSRENGGFQVLWKHVKNGLLDTLAQRSCPINVGHD